MISRFITYLSSLVGMVLAYWIYALLVVPQIEPSNRAEDKDADEETVAPTFRRPYDHIFPEGAWERDNPKVLAMEHGALFVREYRPLDDQELELRPCTFVLFSGGGAGSREARPVVIEAPEGAQIRFDESSNISRAKLGRVVQGFLRGQITIRSPESSPGMNDDLLIVTRNVQINEGTIFTPHEVTMKFGLNHGRGRDLSIAISKSGPRLGKLRDGIQSLGVKSLTLKQLDSLSLQVPYKGSPLGGKTFLSKINPQRFGRRSDGNDTVRMIPVEVTCKADFVLNLQDQTASFEDNVQVVCLRTDGRGDQLDCQKLEIGFLLRTEDGAKDGTGPSPPNGRWTFEPERISAIGFPVTLSVPSLGATVTGRKLEYNLKTRRVQIEERDGSARIEFNGSEVEAPLIDYQMAEDGRLGTLLASGPGGLKAVVGDDKRLIRASWREAVSIQPFENNKVLSLRDDAYVEAEEWGSIASHELHLYLNEVTDGSNKVTIEPDRMLAKGNVEVNSAQLTDRSDELQVWFRKAIKKTTSQVGMLAANRAIGSSLGKQPKNTRRDSTSTSKFDLRGKLVQLEVVLGDTTAVERATIKGDVTLKQLNSASNGQPLEMSGDFVQYEAGTSDNPKARLEGKPAKISARGMSIHGAAVQLLQGDNYVWIDGAGEMILPVGGRNLSQGIVVGEKPVVVTWAKGMEFDGHSARFSGDVRTQGTFRMRTTPDMHVEATSGVLTVSLSRPIDFLNLRPAPNLTAKLFQFAENVHLVNRSTDHDGNLESVDEFVALNLSIDQITGEISSKGAGTVMTIRRGQDVLSRTQFGGGRGLSVPGIGNRPESSPAVARASPSLTYLETDFRLGIAGDIHDREIRFLGDVHTVYGPVSSWDTRIDPRAIQKAANDLMLLKCHELVVREMGQIQDPQRPHENRPAFELEAIGNADVLSESFRAQADRIGYAEVKGQLVMEGNGRRKAMLERFSRTGPAPMQQLSARRILYWPGTNNFKIDDAEFKVENSAIAPQAGLNPLTPNAAGYQWRTVFPAGQALRN